MVNFSQYLYSFHEFSLTTSIHGFYYVAKSKGPAKVAWWLFWLAMFTIMTRSCVNIIMEYYQFDIHTASKYKQEKEIDFPAITFCSQFGVSTSKLNFSEAALFEYITIYSRDNKDIVPNILKSKELCNISSKNSQQIDIKTVLDQGVLTMGKMIGWTSLEAVKKCWWNNNEMQCNGLFVNTVTSSGICFLFVPTDKKMSISKLDESVNQSLIIERKILFGGPNNGLRLLLDVGQGDKCDVARKYEGNGFKVGIHDPLNFVQLFDYDPFITLNPGFEIDIILQPTVYKRETAHLGHCKLPIYNVFGGSTYFSSICVSLCAFRTIINSCKCYAVSGNTEVETAVYQTLLGLNFSLLKKCESIDEMICIKNLALNILEYVNTFCPECIQPCFETKYKSLLTYKKFPSVRAAKFFPTSFRLTDNVTQMKKSYLTVNFYFDSMTVLHVSETQKITIEDVLMFFGGAIGLFLGASYISLQEVVQLLVHWSLKLLLRLVNKMKKNRIKSVVNLKNQAKGVQLVVKSSIQKEKHAKRKVKQRHVIVKHFKQISSIEDGKVEMQNRQ